MRGFTATLPMTTADMLSALTTAPLEYSYFDQGKLGAWAGPKHWKFKPMSRLNPDGEKTKGRKKKVNISIKLLNEFIFECIIKILTFLFYFVTQLQFAVELFRCYYLSYICKVILFVCLLVCMSDHNSVIS